MLIFPKADQTWGLFDDGSCLVFMHAFIHCIHTFYSIGNYGPHEYLSVNKK